VIYLGFDVGDQFYDDALSLASVRSLFKRTVLEAGA
jgi:hypothetical protein